MARQKKPFMTVSLTQNQASVLVRALDLYSRVHMGQLEYVADPLMGPLSTEQFHWLKDQLRTASHIVHGLGPNASHSILSEKISDDARIAWDIQQVVRNVLSWSRAPEGGHGVSFDTPMKSSKEPLPKTDPPVESGQSRFRREGLEPL